MPLIPGYIAFITGNKLEELLEKKSINLLPIFLFTIGFSIVFIIFGASATFLGKFLLYNSFPLRIIAGLIIIIFSRGLYFFQDFVVQKLPFTQFYLNYFFESIKNMFEIWKNLISSY